MSTDAAVPTAQQDALTLLPLLKEYAAKIRSLADQTYKPSEISPNMVVTVNRAVRVQEYVGYLGEQFRTLRPHVEKIASHASQLIEHTELDYFTGIELKLRLSEVELALRHAVLLFGDAKEKQRLSQ